VILDRRCPTTFGEEGRPVRRLRSRSLIPLFFAVLAPWLALPSTAQVSGGDPSPELRRQIIDAGMAPWNGRRISLDDTLRGPNRERVSLRQLVGKPILAYNYAQW
jgi:hypothetical protein